MKRLIIFIFCIPVLLGADGLWDKGQKWFTDSQAWKPAVMDSLFLTCDDKGKEEERTLESYKIDYSNSEAVMILISSTKNGKDQTVKRQKELKEQEKKAKTDNNMNFGFDETDHPLNPVLQSKVIYAQKGTTWIGVNECIEYGFTVKKDKNKMIGSIFLSKSKGTPVRMTYTIDPLPAMANQLSITQNYSGSLNGITTMSSMEFSGSGGILFIQKKITGTISFSGYFFKN